MKKLLCTVLMGVILLSGLSLGCGMARDDVKPLKHLRIGYQPSTHQIAEMTAMEKGWWEEGLAKFGVEKVTDKEFPSGPPEMAVMSAGDLDIAYVGATPPITAIDKGLKAKIVAGVQTQGSELALSPSRAEQYEGPQDLKGLNLATFPPGSIQDTVLRRWLRENDLDPEKDLNIIGMGGSEAISHLKAKSVDGIFLPSPNCTVAEVQGAGKIVVRSGEMWPNHACCCLVVSDKLIQDHPELVKEIIKIHIRATVYNTNNPDEAAQIYADRVGWDVDDVKLSFKLWDGRWVHDPYIGLDCTLEYAKTLYDLGFVDKLLTQEDLFDTSFYDSAIQEILTECLG
jgi:NitT/TauT family transport system substrate-binding protein